MADAAGITGLLRCLGQALSSIAPAQAGRAATDALLPSGPMGLTLSEVQVDEWDGVAVEGVTVVLDKSIYASESQAFGVRGEHDCLDTPGTQRPGLRQFGMEVGRAVTVAPVFGKYP